MVKVWPGIPEPGDRYQIYGVGGGAGALTRKLLVRTCVPAAKPVVVA